MSVHRVIHDDWAMLVHMGTLHPAPGAYRQTVLSPECCGMGAL